ncbi:unnamed protein product [Jaminaea pallidilutea]
MAPPAKPFGGASTAPRQSKGKFRMGGGSNVASSSRSTHDNGNGSSSSSKKRKAPPPAADSAIESDAEDDSEDDDDVGGLRGTAASGGEESATDDEGAIARATKAAKSDKTSKRKRRAVSPGAFGEAVDAFLGGGEAGGEGATESEQDDEQEEQESAAAKRARPSVEKIDSRNQQAPIFSLAPSVRTRIASSNLSAKASRVALAERRAREERGRVRDVIGSWGRPGQKPNGEGEGEEDGILAAGGAADDEWAQSGGTKGYERRLRKVAQRGVVKLFNAIRAAQSTTQEDVEEDQAQKSRAVVAGDKAGAGAGGGSSGGKGAASAKVPASNRNPLGGKDKDLADLSKANFLDLIRSGSTSKAKA